MAILEGYPWTKLQGKFNSNPMTLQGFPLGSDAFSPLASPMDGRQTGEKS
jgi:hypothetical protein